MVIYDKMNFSILKRHLLNTYLPLILIALTVATIYSNIYDCPFVFDDTEQIAEKVKIRDLTNYFSLDQLLKPRGVVDFTFALNYKFGKLSVFGYHLFNVLVHIANGFVVYFLATLIFRQALNRSIRQLSIPTMSLFAALIFVSHPIQTQAVTYTVQRYASMAAMFYMASVLFYLKGRVVAESSKLKAERINDRGQRTEVGGHGTEQKGNSAFSFQLSAFTYIALSILCGMMAFLSKQNTASLPGAILLVEYLFIDRTWQGWKKKMPWFVLVFTLWTVFVLYVCGFFHVGLQGRGLLEDVSNLMQEAKTVSRWDYLCTQFNVLVVYIRLLFLPIGQNLDYLYPFKHGFFDAYTPLAFLFLTGLVGLGVWNTKRRPIISFGILWFFITLSVESSIIPINDALYEHRLYLPLFGFALIVSYLIFCSFSNKQVWAIVISVCIIVSLGTATYLRNRVWHDGITFWSDVISKNPKNYRALSGLGLALEEQGRHTEATRHYWEALRIESGYVPAYFNLGNALSAQGRLNEAIRHYLDALRIKPEYARAHNNLGNVLSVQGKLDEAIRHYSEALRIKPDWATAHNNLGVVLAAQGKLDEAIRHYSEALRIKPDWATAHNNIGKALMRQGRYVDAITHLDKALRIEVDYAEAHNNLGGALEEQGKLMEAMRHYSEALRIKPDYADAHNNMGVLLGRRGQHTAAKRHFSDALRINPDFAEAQNNLAISLRFMGTSSGASNTDAKP
jgi:tetratricopeptide (TPR) repeat protein